MWCHSAFINYTFAESALPFIGQAERVPNGGRPTLQKLFAIRVRRECEFDGAVIESALRYQSDELLDILTCGDLIC